MGDLFGYARQQARDQSALNDAAYEVLLAAVPATAWPDATQTTYQVVSQPPQYTSAVVCYDPSLVVTPTVAYGSRLLESLRNARRSLDASSGESLQELHVAALETIAAEPAIFAVHFLAGLLTALENAVRALGALAYAALELTAKVLWCSVEGAAVDLWAQLEAWLAGGDKPVLPTGSAVCQKFEAQTEAVYDAVVGGIERLDHLLDHPAELIDAGAEIVTYLYDLVAALGLGDHYATVVRDPAKLGAFVGVLTGEIGMLIAPAFLGGRAAQAAEVASAAGAADLAGLAKTKVQMTAIEALQQAAAASRNARLEALAAGVAVDEAAVLAATQSAGAESRAILRGATLSRIESFGRDQGARLAKLVAGTPAARLVQGLTRAMETLAAATEVVVLRVAPYDETREALSAINASQRLIIGTDAVAGGAPLADAANVALFQQEDALLEAAHLIDGRFIGSGAPKQVAADLAAAGLSNRTKAPAFALLRSTHRTTIERLRALGAPLPDVTAESITKRMLSGLPIKTSTPNALLIVDDTTRGWEVTAAQYRLYRSSPVVAHPAWAAMEERLFEIQKGMLSALRTADPAEFAAVRDAWPEFAAWLANHPY